MKLVNMKIAKRSIIKFGIVTTIALPVLTASCFTLPSPKRNKVEDKDQNVIDKYSDRFKDTATTHTSTIPSELLLSGSPSQSELGINLITEQELNNDNITLTFDIKEKNDDNGFIELEANLMKGSKAFSKLITISGYLKLNELNASKVNQQLSHIEDTYFTELISSFPSSLDSVDSIIQQSELHQKTGVNLQSIVQISGVDLTYKISDKSDQMGTINLKVIAQAGEITKEKDVLIKGFKSTNADLNEINEFFTKILPAYSTTITAVTADGLVELNQTVTEAQIGISFNIPDFNGAILTITVIDVQTAKGEIKIKTTISKNGVVNDKISIVSGFVPQDYVDAKKIVDTFISCDTSKSDKLPSSIGAIGSMVTSNELGISQPSSTNDVALKFEITQINDDAGWLMVDITGTKGESTYTNSITITSFMTSATQDILDVLNEIRDSRTTLTSISIPSSATINSTISNTSLGFTEPTDLKGTLVKYVVKSRNENAGSVVLSVTVSKNKGTTQTKDITISGFKSSSQIRADVEEVLSNITDSTTSKSDEPANAIGNIGDVVDNVKLGTSLALINTLNVNVRLTIQSINVETGVITLSVTGEKEGISIDKSIKVIGYKTILKFSNADNVTLSDSVIKSTYFGSVIADATNTNTYFSEGSTINGYIIELNNGTKFVFETGNAGTVGFFRNFNFTQQNEDESIKNNLISYVNDAMKYLNLGITTTSNLKFIYSPFRSGYEYTQGFTNTGLWGNTEIWMNNHYWDIRKYETFMTDTNWNFEDITLPSYSFHKSYWGSISTLLHEMGHKELETALGHFNEDNSVARNSTAYPLPFNNSIKGYDGVSVASKFISSFSKYGIDISGLFTNLADSGGGIWASENNNNLTYNNPSLTQINQYVQAIYGKDLKNSLGQVYDSDIATDFRSKANFTNQSVVWSYSDGVAGNTSYQNSKDWFVNSAYHSFVKKSARYSADTNYMFNLNEFLTRMAMVLSGGWNDDGGQIYSESLLAIYSNAIYSNPWKSHKLSPTQSSLTNGSAIAGYTNASSIVSSKTYTDSTLQEIFHFSSRLGHENIMKILNNREELLQEMILLSYGGGNQVAFDTKTELKTTAGNHLSLTEFKVYGVSTTKDVSFDFGWRRATSLSKYTVPENDYKRITWRSGKDKVTTNLYYFYVSVPLNLNLTSSISANFAALSSSADARKELEPIIKVNNSNWTTNVSLFTDYTDVYTRSYPLVSMSSGSVKIGYPYITIDPSLAKTIYAPLIKV